MLYSIYVPKRKYVLHSPCILMGLSVEVYEKIRIFLCTEPPMDQGPLIDPFTSLFSTKEKEKEIRFSMLPA